MNDIPLKQMMAKVIIKVHQNNSTQGDWYITGEEVNTWVNASSLETGVVLERCGAVLEEAC